MKLLIQRVTYGKVTIDNKTVGEIDKGLVVFVGISNTDTKDIADKFINKLTKLRIFEDEDGKTNLSIDDVKGSILFISQFTLYANCKKGNRPSFIEAGKPDMANELYLYMYDKLKEIVPTEKGEFGADMKIELLNDGPFTIILDDSIL